MKKAEQMEGEDPLLHIDKCCLVSRMNEHPINYIKKIQKIPVLVIESLLILFIKLF